jgi:hypothetical protein
LVICLYIVYFLIKQLAPKVYELVSLQGGKKLIDTSRKLNTSQTLTSYLELNPSGDFQYQYSLSFWFYLNSNPPNTNPSYNSFVSLLNYGGKPNVLYNAHFNKLKITTKDDSNQVTNASDSNEKEVYQTDNVLLQKWNNIIVNISREYFESSIISCNN